MSAARPSLREAVGSAINTSNLSGSRASVLNALAAGSDRLGALLWRIKYGNDHKLHTLMAAKTILVARVHANRSRVPSARLMLVVEAALKEWLDDRCRACHGRRYVGSEYGDPKAMRERCPEGCVRDGEAGVGGGTGLYVKAGIFATAQERMMNRVTCQACAGKGWKESVRIDASKTTVCRACNGEGRLRASPGRRAVAIGVTRPVYQKQWAAKYERALELMRSVDKMTGKTVANAMRSLDGAPGLDFMDEAEVLAWQSERGRIPRGGLK